MKVKELVEILSKRNPESYVTAELEGDEFDLIWIGSNTNPTKGDILAIKDNEWNITNPIILRYYDKEGECKV